MMRKIFLIVLLQCIFLSSYSQELFCNVQVISPQVEGTNKRVFETLQNAMFDFLNNRKWTNYDFAIDERIECSILLTIEERISSDEFKGRLNVVVRRPVYQSSYYSPIFNYVDRDIRFNYIEYQPLELMENAYSSELTALLSYYAYMILGFDFDSFSLYGGTPFFEKAQSIVNTAQNAPTIGWKAFDSPKNRYWLVENCLNATYQPIRTFSYEYHRKGLDMMSNQINVGRAAISNNLNLLDQVYSNRPGLYLIQVLMDAKREEIIKIYSEGSVNEKSRAIQVFSKIDPANSSRFQEFLK